MCPFLFSLDSRKLTGKYYNRNMQSLLYQLEPSHDQPDY